MIKRFVYVFFGALLVLACCGRNPAAAQYFKMNDDQWQVSFPFKIIRNMVVVKVKLNDKGPFNFILDTGVGLVIVTDPKLADSLAITDKRIIKLAGVGNNDELEAYTSSNVKLELPGLESVNVGAAFYKEDYFGLANYAGIPIHGLLGYEFFNKLVVKLDFNDSTLTAYRPKDFRASKRFDKIPLTIERNKPYINTTVSFYDKSERLCKLVVDIGAGHALSLENTKQNQWPTEKSIAANLGMGLTGPINGEIGRISKLALGKYTVENVLSSFPEKVERRNTEINRDGNLGLDLLKRFIVIFDYPGGNLYLRSRGYALREPQEHDMSGIEYFAGGNSLKQVFISRVEPGSPGDMIGLTEDDELLRVNLKPVHQLSLEELDNIFKSGDGKSLLLDIKRQTQQERLILTLKRRI